MRALIAGLCLAGVAGAMPAQAAHEWRAAWGAPHPFALLGTRILQSDGQTGDRAGGQTGSQTGDSLQAALGLARPFGLSGLSFASAVLAGGVRGWESHAGMLEGPGYREGHAGLARRLRLGAGQRLLIGLRLFALQAGGEALPARIAVTALLAARPPGMKAVVLEAGLVDLPLFGSGDGPAPLLVGRLLLTARGRRLCAEYMLTAEGAGETTLAALLPMGRVSFLQMLRGATGEGSAMILLRAGCWEIGIGEAWHPHLGWTPSVSLLRWSGR